MEERARSEKRIAHRELEETLGHRVCPAVQRWWQVAATWQSVPGSIAHRRPRPPQATVSPKGSSMGWARHCQDSWWSAGYARHFWVPRLTLCSAEWHSPSLVLSLLCINLFEGSSFRGALRMRMAMLYSSRGLQQKCLDVTQVLEQETTSVQGCTVL